MNKDEEISKLEVELDGLIESFGKKQAESQSRIGILTRQRDKAEAARSSIKIESDFTRSLLTEYFWKLTILIMAVWASTNLLGLIF